MVHGSPTNEKDGVVGDDTVLSPRHSPQDSPMQDFLKNINSLDIVHTVAHDMHHLTAFDNRRTVERPKTWPDGVPGPTL